MSTRTRRRSPAPERRSELGRNQPGAGGEENTDQATADADERLLHRVEAAVDLMDPVFYFLSQFKSRSVDLGVDLRVEAIDLRVDLRVDFGVEAVDPGFDPREPRVDAVVQVIEPVVVPAVHQRLHDDGC